MNHIDCPALDGRSPLGFLAALGLHHLAVTHADPDATLAWHPARCAARLRTNQATTLDELVDWLSALVTDLDAGVLQPGWPAGFPPPGEAPDKLVPHRDGFAELVADHSGAVDLIGALVTDLAVNDAGRVRRTQMVAPTGKQSFATMLRNQATTVAEQPNHLRDALTRWRRVSGTTAEGFDSAAIIGGADDQTGKPGERAVPGAVWLACAGLPRYRLAIDEAGRISTTTWRHVGRQPHMMWPLWTPDLDTHAITALLEHPRIRARATADGGLHTDLADLTPFGVTRICAAHRVSTGKSDGPLVAVPVRGSSSPVHPRAR